MSEQRKIYWRGLEELTNDPSFVKNADKEFVDLPSASPEAGNNGGSTLDNLTPHRRDFLKAMGFGMAAVSLAACETPVKKAIPFLNKPEEYDPSIANYYASSFTEGGDYAAVLVKTREGRPIKIEGNKLSSVTKGGTSARVQASVLSLYDTERYKTPMNAGASTTWEAVDKIVADKLAGGAKVAVVTNTILSPSLKAALAAFSNKSGATVVTYDPRSAYGITKANELSFGKAVVPSYKLHNADVIVSFGADFLGTWISPIEFARQFAVRRKVAKNKTNMSKVFAFEAAFSLTGANADYRTGVRPSEEGAYVAALYNAVAAQKGGATVAGGKVENAEKITAAAKALVAAGNKAVVLAGSNDPNIQVLVNGINAMLGAYGTTIDLDTPLHTRQGNDEQMNAFIGDLKGGTYDTVIFLNANPVYDHPRGEEIQAALGKVSLSISTAYRPDETAAACKIVAPDHHGLESWGDAEPKKGHYSLSQPAISPIFTTRQVIESFLAWAGQPKDAYSFVKDWWKDNLYNKQSNYLTFRDFWNYSLHDGVLELGRPSFRASIVPAAVQRDSSGNVIPTAIENPSDAYAWEYTITGGNVSVSGSALASAADAVASTYRGGEGLDLVIFETIALGAGSDANNPWLQEMPDPITRACWENYITIPQSMAREWDNLKVFEGNTITATLSVNGKTIEIPVLVQPGQAKGTIGLAMGYGRTVCGAAGKDRGINAFTLVGIKNGVQQYFATGAKLDKTGKEYRLAHVQTHHTIMERHVVQETTLTEYKKNPMAGRHIEKITSVEKGEIVASDLSLWGPKDLHKRPNHAWGMVVDLNSCIGCSACVISCHAENNVPIVGKEEVLNRREMHWIRIDRYYSSSWKEGDDRLVMEEAADNPEVVFQPMMCQHCNNAPCETVCPVAATTHSTEGLNQMAYNRCIGTRYCANNCPYKVRRFNWFSYPQNAERFPLNFPTLSDLGRMVLNPDVTVRARGVMEKCSMCVQRIQEGKLNAKKEGRRPVDGEIVTACASACPTDAITFGDMNDPESKIAQLISEEKQGRNFSVLEQINTNPSVSYLVKVRNSESTIFAS